MAFGDYHACDHCRERKTFYDADMNFGYTPDGTILYGGYTDNGVYIGYRAYVLCHECEKTHKITIVPRDSDTHPKDGDAKQGSARE